MALIGLYPANQVVQLRSSNRNGFTGTGHAKQLRSVSDPGTNEYVPTLQFLQVAPEIAPHAVEYFPAEQSLQLFGVLDPSQNR